MTPRTGIPGCHRCTGPVINDVGIGHDPDTASAIPCWILSAVCGTSARAEPRPHAVKTTAVLRSSADERAEPEDYRPGIMSDQTAKPGSTIAAARPNDWCWCPSCHESWRTDLLRDEALAHCPLCDGPVIPWTDALATFGARHAA